MARVCSSCHVSKPETSFYGRGGRPSYECKACHSDRKKSVKQARREAGITDDIGSCIRCGETKPAAEFRVNWARRSGLESRCRACVSHEDRRDRFNVSAEQYIAMLEEQGGVCAICAQPETTIANHGGGPKALAVDHDHATGDVRGLLCSNCNKGIGNLQDSLAIVLAAATYLTKHKGA